MIQVKRGSTQKWSGVTLAPGQPGYDKTKHKLKIGDGTTEWSDLPYVSGLSADEVVDSEENARKRLDADKYDVTPITYGTDAPTEATIGKLYLQQDTEPEVDYVIETGINGIWTYQKWKSGIAKCWGTHSISTSLQNTFEESALAYAGISSVSYPFTFKNTPTEVATVQSYGGLAWLANSAMNTRSSSGSYVIISPDKQLTTVSYSISIQVEGFWR